MTTELKHDTVGLQESVGWRVPLRWVHGQSKSLEDSVEQCLLALVHATPGNPGQTCHDCSTLLTYTHTYRWAVP